MPIVYSKGYNITACGIEKMHPFDSTKYRRIWHFLHQKNVLDHERHKFYYPEDLPKRNWMNEVMTKCYLLSHNYSISISRYVELPLCFLPAWFLRSQLLEPMLLGTRGSVEASYLAMTKGWAINL
jgi:histone deacetylase 11